VTAHFLLLGLANHVSDSQHGLSDTGRMQPVLMRHSTDTDAGFWASACLTLFLTSPAQAVPL
jgi:hypothetical protein